MTRPRFRAFAFVLALPLAAAAQPSAFEACHAAAATTVAMIACNHAERERWAARLALAEAALRRRFGSEAEHLVDALSQSWPAWRDAACAAEAHAEAAGGTMSGIIGSACQARMTRERVAEIEALLAR